MGWYDGEARRLESADPPDGKYLPDEPASFARSMNSSVKRNLFRLPNLGLSRCQATHAVELVDNEVNVCFGSSWYPGYFQSLTAQTVKKDSTTDATEVVDSSSAWYEIRGLHERQVAISTVANENEQADHLETKLLLEATTGHLFKQRKFRNL